MNANMIGSDWVNRSQFSNHLYKDSGGCHLTLIKTTQVKFLNATWDTTAQQWLEYALSPMLWGRFGTQNLSQYP